MILLGNGTVITGDANRPLIEEGGVVVEEDRIVDVGPWKELKASYPIQEWIDAREGVIMPGLFIPHFHLYSTFARGLPLKKPLPKNFLEILEGLWWQLDCLLTEEDIYYSALLGLLELVKKGCIGIFDHHSSPRCIPGSLDAIAQAVTQVGIPASLCYEVSDRHGFEGAQEGMAENLRFIQKCGSHHPFLQAHFGLHASMTLSEETLADCQEKTQDLAVGFHVHTAEGREDLEHAQKQGYEGVVTRLDRFGIWNPRSLAVHAVHVSHKEIQLLKRRGAMVIHNPRSNMNNGVGVAPIQKMMDQGLTVGLGTDSCTWDPFLELKSAYLLQNHHHQDPGAGASVFSTLLTHNPQIMASVFPCITGQLRKGHLAHLLILNYQPPTPLTQETIPSHLLYGLSGDQVELVMVKGQVRVQEKKLVSLAEGEIFRRGREQAQNFWERWEKHVLSTPQSRQGPPSSKREEGHPPGRRK